MILALPILGPPDVSTVNEKDLVMQAVMCAFAFPIALCSVYLLASLVDAAVKLAGAK